ncbi:hypothetical protein [Aestuariispira ectoiniformans]|uniref:hypothetical protein n=1 Tax=Aestuariispira ectoiniformans TaxID=2775080 RepID=UPI00223C1DF8|nr:hypothetical protein [Aestuariispira ectoiniformans]
MTPEIRATSLLELLRDLIDVMERENTLLERPRSQDLAPIVEEKQKLFQQYETQIRELAATTGFSAVLGDDLRSQLKKLSEDFERVSKENERRLRLAARTSSMIVERIKEAATRASGTNLASYGNSGTQREDTRKAAPIAVDQTL